MKKKKHFRSFDMDKLNEDTASEKRISKQKKSLILLTRQTARLPHFIFYDYC